MDVPRYRWRQLFAVLILASSGMWLLLLLNPTLNGEHRDISNNLGKRSDGPGRFAEHPDDQPMSSGIISYGIVTEAPVVPGGFAVHPRANFELRPRVFFKGRKAWQRCVAKGETLQEAMVDLKAPGVVRETQHQDYSAFQKWGWTETRLENKNYDSDADQLASIGVDAQIGNVEISWRHSEDMVLSGQTYPATRAVYTNVYWPKAGLIICENNVSPGSDPPGSDRPKHVTPKPVNPLLLPGLSRWSDAVFLTWRQLVFENPESEQKSQLRGLKWILRSSISNQETQLIISMALKKAKKQHKNGVPSEWPGVTFTPNDIGWHALLGSDNVQGICYLLIQHQEALGHKVIKSLQVWNDYPEGKWPPSILVQIGDYEDRSPVEYTGAVQPRTDGAFTCEESSSKGALIRLGMQQPLTVPAQHRKSEFEEYQDLAAWGYEQSPNQQPPKGEADGWTKGLQTLGIDIHLGEGFKIQWTHIRTTQHESSKGKLLNHEPTNAEFANTFYPSGGLIIANSNYSPRSRLPKVNLPALRHWSDIAYLTWTHLQTHSQPQNPLPNQQPKKLNHILFESILNTPTTEAIEIAVSEQFANDELQQWPGRLFTPEMKTFDMLLATPIVTGVCWLLIQHQEAFGRREVKSIRVFEGSGIDWPRLSVEIGDVDGSVKDGGKGELLATKDGSALDAGLAARGDEDETGTAGPVCEEEPFEVAVAKGKLLLSYLDGTGSPPEFHATSPFTRYEQLAEEGWTEKIEGRVAKGSYSALLKEVGIDIELHDPKGINVWYDHANTVTKNGNTAELPPDHYANVFWPAAGLLIATANYTPRYRFYNTARDPNEPMPLQHWSDIIFLAWEHLQADRSPDYQPLDYVLRETVTNDATKETLEAALKASSVLSGRPGQWPGYLFLPGSRGFEAMLSTPNVSGVCWLLIQHKVQWGERSIKSIMAWVGRGGAALTLLIEIGDVVGGYQRVEGGGVGAV